MKTGTNQLSLHSIKNREKKINPQPQYQRGSVWTRAKKQLLIDTIFRGYDIPKFYLRVVENSEYEHEVVDGQQRLRSIWEFMDDEFPFGEDSKYFDNLPNMVGKYYSELGSDEQDLFGAFNISITELRDANDLEVTELFRRLQEGSTLTPPEKRNATLGDIRDFIHELSEHQILFKTTMKNDRFQHDDLVAHVTMIQLNGGPVEIKAANLMKFYEQNKDFDKTSRSAEKVKKVLNYLNKVFKDNTPELRIKWGFVDIYWLVSELIDKYDIKNRHEDFYDFYIGFEQSRKMVDDASELIINNDDNFSNKDLYDYIQSFQSEGAKKVNLEKRHEIYKRRFLSSYSDLIAKDKKRDFTHDERIVLWRNAGMKCQLCKENIGLEDMHADHIKPFSAGGFTSIENGQCLCSKCNLNKSDRY